jgi:hypothetical protein
MSSPGGEGGKCEARGGAELEEQKGAAMEVTCHYELHLHDSSVQPRTTLPGSHTLTSQKSPTWESEHKSSCPESRPADHSQLLKTFEVSLWGAWNTAEPEIVVKRGGSAPSWGSWRSVLLLLPCHPCP